MFVKNISMGSEWVEAYYSTRVILVESLWWGGVPVEGEEGGEGFFYFFL